MLPRWAISVARFPISAILWARGRAKRHFTDKQKLVREGSRVVTPVIESAEHFNPAAVSFGTPDEIRERMTPRESDWLERRSALLIYANQHPSEKIRKLGHDAANAIDQARIAVLWLFQSQKSPQSYEAFQQAEARHDEAKRAAHTLMDAIRAY